MTARTMPTASRYCPLAYRIHAWATITSGLGLQRHRLLGRRPGPVDPHLLARIVAVEVGRGVGDRRVGERELRSWVTTSSNIWSANSAVAGSSQSAYGGGTVAAGASCTVIVDVVADLPGALLNVTGSLTSSLGDSGGAQATLVVSAPTPEIPTLSGWGLLLMLGSLAGIAGRRLRAG